VTRGAGAERTTGIAPSDLRVEVSCCALLPPTKPPKLTAEQVMPIARRRPSELPGGTSFAGRTQAQGQGPVAPPRRAGAGPRAAPGCCHVAIRPASGSRGDHDRASKSDSADAGHVLLL
jgi:hypothetical protein